MSEVMTRHSVDRRTSTSPSAEPSLAILLDLAPDDSAERAAFAQARVQAERRAERRAAALAAEQAELTELAQLAPLAALPHSTGGAPVLDQPRGRHAVTSGRHAAPAGRPDGVMIPLQLAAAAPTDRPRHAIPRPPVPPQTQTQTQTQTQAQPEPFLPATDLIRAETRRSRRRAMPQRSGYKQPAIAALALVGVFAAAQASASEGPAVVSAVAKAAARASTGADLSVQGTSRSGTREGMPSADSVPAAGVALQATAQLSDTGEQALERAAAVADEAQARAEAVAAAAAKAAADAAAAAEAAKRLVAPIGTNIVSGFGYRVDPFGWGTSMHEGLDYASGCGAEIYSAGAGTVIESGWMGGYGWRVVVDHGVIDGHALQSTYNHMVQPGVGVGTVVEKGTVIGYIGSTGASTGCHLHFEIKQDGVLVDPLMILPAS